MRYAVELLLPANDRAQIQQISEVFSAEMVRPPEQTREPTILTALVIAGAALEVINGLLELRERVLAGKLQRFGVRNLDGDTVEVTELTADNAKDFLGDDSDDDT